MRLRTSLATVGLFLFSFTTAFSQTNTTSYEIIEIQPLGGSGPGFYSFASSINATNQVCGDSLNGSGQDHAFFWDNGTLNDLGTLGGSTSIAQGINNNKDVVGFSYLSGGDYHATLWPQASSIQDLGALGSGRFSYAAGINNPGQVIGFSETGDRDFEGSAFIWQSGSMRSIGALPGDNFSAGAAINDNGHAVGYSRGDLGQHPFFYDGASMHQIGTLSGQAFAINTNDQVAGYMDAGSGMYQAFVSQSSGAVTLLPGLADSRFYFAYGINNNGDIVGQSYGDTSGYRAVIWKDGVATDLNTRIPTNSVWGVLNGALAINDAGSIVGYGALTNGQSRAFLLKPASHLILVDANRDGEIKFDDDSDNTTSDKPYRFWLNFDHDSSGQDVETGDLDAFDTTISHVRDLEDFARIQIQLDSSVKKKIDEGDKLAIETTGGLQINLYKAVNPSTDYLFDQSVADQQVDGTFTANGVTKNFGQALDQSDISPWIDAQEYGDNPISFIFEGRAEGEGTVKIVLKRPDGTVERSGEVHVKLMKVGDMFEGAHVTTARADNRFRLPWEPPYTYVDLIYEPPNVGYANDTPNFQKPSDETQQLIVFVHGFNNTDFVKQNWSEMMFKRLWHQDYKGRFASMFWPTPLESEGVDVILSTEFFGFKYGSSLQGYLGELKDRLSGYTINVAAHSAGNIIVGEALKQGATIDNYVLMQAAVAASSYDSNAPVDDGLNKQENAHPTYDPAQQMDYRGYLQNVQGNLVNFYNPVDGALETGFRLDIFHGFKKVSWKIFQLEFKPFDPEEKKVQYTYDKKLGVPILELPGKPKSRDVTNIHESMSFVARSRTKAVGAEGGTGGSIDSVVNLKATFNFGDTREEHSAQFNRNIQNVHEFYKQLGVKLGVLAP